MFDTEFDDEFEDRAPRKRPRLFTVEQIKPQDGQPVVIQAAPVTREMLSEDQVVVFDEIHRWLRDPNARLYLKIGGLAGTGKTTLVAALAHGLSSRRISIAFVAYTGKAANVLSRKLRAQGIDAYCGTLHSLMYKPMVDSKTGRVIGWFKRENLDVFQLVIVDEASMVGEELWKDLLSYDIPVIAVGDHGQLPPVGKDAINLMQEPDLRLERIHRQAAGNPVLALAHHVREGGEVRKFRAADDRVRIVRMFPEVADVIVNGGLDVAAICYFNKTRNQINAMVRRLRGFEGPDPDPGDIVVCLKNKDGVLFNGMRGVLRQIGSEVDAKFRAQAVIDFPDDSFRIREAMVNLSQFNRDKTFDDLTQIPGHPMGWWDAGLLFDYGYAITCHKSQGSQWREVVIRHETFFKDSNDTRRRWIYTAVTRAAERVYVIP